MADSGYITQEAADQATRRAVDARAACARIGGALLRRLRRPTARERVSGTDDHDDRGGRGVHDARSPPPAPRAGRGSRRSDAMSTSCCRGASGRVVPKRRCIAVDPRTGEILAHGRRALLQPVAVQPRGRRRAGSRDRSSSRSSTSPRSSRPSKKDGPNVTPAAIVDDEPETWEIDDQVWEPANYENEYDGPITCGERWPGRATWRRSRSRNRLDSTTSPRSGSRLGVGNAPQGVSVDCARRLRGHATRNRDRLHHLPEHGDAPAARARCDHRVAA